MSHKLIISITVASICTLLAGLYLLWSIFAVVTTTEQYVEFPDTSNVATTSVPTSELFIRGENGATFPAVALIRDESTKQLADDFYTVTDDENIYNIYYYTTDGTIMVALYQTPLKFSRAYAEKKLRTIAPYSDEELCSMPILVYTNGYVDARYAGIDLGLSFCPNSVILE